MCLRYDLSNVCGMWNGRVWGHVGGPSPESLIRGRVVGKRAWMALPLGGRCYRQATARSEEFPMSCTLDRFMLLLSLIVSVIVVDAGAVHVRLTVAMAMVMVVAVTPRS